MSETIYMGIITLSPGLPIRKEVLGESFDVRIGGTAGKLFMPELPQDLNIEKIDFRQNLEPPRGVRSWRRGGERFEWGHPVSIPRFDCYVERAAVEIDIPKNQARESIQKIYESIHEWMDLCGQYICLAKRQVSPGTKITLKGSNIFDIYAISNGDMEPIFDEHPICVDGATAGIGRVLEIESVRKILKLCSEGIEPPLEYRILLESSRALVRRDYRTAIIEAAAAVEVCLTSFIMEEFSTQNIPYGEKLLSKFRMLGGRFELAGIMGLNFAGKDYKSLIVTPRNLVIHQAQFPERDIAKSVVNEADDFIRKYSKVKIPLGVI